MGEEIVRSKADDYTTYGKLKEPEFFSSELNASCWRGMLQQSSILTDSMGCLLFDIISLKYRVNEQCFLEQAEQSPVPDKN